ncbi:MAG: hypothetical protein EX254_03530 [Flavobacteriaceae bacterium]|nr:MAG: hypothetical protein EX254_03530 [Flavobacteriaceae bacterium]
MKKNYIFFLLALFSVQFHAQTSCSDAQSDVIYAYSHVKTAYNSNNLSHLKQYSARSLEAFERAKAKLNACKCEESYNAAYDGTEALIRVEQAKTYEDGRFYVKKAREFAKETIENLEICTKMSDADLDLVELQHQQFKLKQQQIELQLKEEQIKVMLAEKEKKESQIKKNQLIETNEVAIKASIDAFNDVLQACGCNAEVTNSNTDTSNLALSSMDTIKNFYLTTVKQITSNYLSALNQCNIR